MRSPAPDDGSHPTMIGRMVMVALVVAPLLYGSAVGAQSFETTDDLVYGGYALLIEVVVAEDGTSGGTAGIVASSQAVDAIADLFDISREEACRRVVYPHADQDRPAYLNPQLWTETDRFNEPGNCRYRFRYPSGTELSVINVSPTGRITYLENIDSIDPSALLDVYILEGTVWDEEVIRPLIDEPGLGDLEPVIVIRMTYPHQPDSLESGNAHLVDGNTLIWVLSPLGTDTVVDLRGGATPFSTDPITPPATVAEEPSDQADPFPWGLLIPAVLGSFAVGWAIGELLSRRNKRSGLSRP